MALFPSRLGLPWIRRTRDAGETRVDASTVTVDLALEYLARVGFPRSHMRARTVHDAEHPTRIHLLITARECYTQLWLLGPHIEAAMRAEATAEGIELASVNFRLSERTVQRFAPDTPTTHHDMAQLIKKLQRARERQRGVADSERNSQP